MSITIHGAPLSPFTRKVMLVAIEKSVPFKRRNLIPYLPPEDFESLSPLKQIPVLEEGDFTLPDSSAIAAYLDAKNPDAPPLYPAEPQSLGSALWIEEYADTALFRTISSGVFGPMFINQLLGKPIDRERIQATVKVDLPVNLSYLNQQLGDKEWFAAGALSLADIAVYSQLANLVHTNTVPSHHAFPALMSHFDRMQRRDSVRELWAAETQFLEDAIKQLGSTVT